MPRATKPAEKALPSQTLIIDNGAFTIKAGFGTENSTTEDCHVIPNCIGRDRGKRVWIGSQLEKCTDFGEIAFRRPVEKGFLVNWEAEKAIWDNSFIDNGAPMQCDPQETNLVLTEAPNTPPALQNNCDQVVFEEYEFSTYSRNLSASLNAYHDIAHYFGSPARETDIGAAPVECLLVVDSGYSHSTVTPLYKGRPIQQAVRRLDVGGKILTNVLKELVSIRHYNMLDETHIMNDVKEAVCFVSDDLKRDLELTWKNTSATRKAVLATDKEIVIDYVLPDYNKDQKGYTRPHDSSLAAKANKISSLAGTAAPTEDYMTLANERFTVPELLFNPGDVGMDAPGLPETIMESLSGLPTGLWPVMLANVLVVGGNANIDGFVTRLETELRQLAPSECTLRVAKAPDPIKSTWLGGAYLACNATAMKAIQVTREEYLENGSGWLGRIFSGAVSR